MKGEQDMLPAMPYIPIAITCRIVDGLHNLCMYFVRIRSRAGDSSAPKWEFRIFSLVEVAGQLYPGISFASICMSVRVGSHSNLEASTGNLYKSTKIFLGSSKLTRTGIDEQFSDFRAFHFLCQG